MPQTPVRHQIRNQQVHSSPLKGTKPGIARAPHRRDHRPHHEEKSSSGDSGRGLRIENKPETPATGSAGVLAGIFSSPPARPILGAPASLPACSPQRARESSRATGSAGAFYEKA